MPSSSNAASPSVGPVARRALFAFLLVFIAARILVILIMTRRMPDLFLHVGGTHVHHLNYGIFLLSAVGAATLFFPLAEAGRRLAAYLYGAGMALTFDEFGLWVHLGGSYWQRASYDAVMVVAGLLALFAFAPRRDRLGRRHALAAVVAVGAALAFGGLLWQSLTLADRKLGPRLQDIESQAPR